MTLASNPPFMRDRLTWLAYTMLAYIGLVQSILGPLIPFLRSELHLNYTLGGSLPAALAIGLMVSGLTGDWFARHWGRAIVFWGGGICLAGGVILLGLGRQFESVFLAALGMGFGSSLTQVMIQALLADQHGARRAIAFTEANVAASLSATLTPILIGTLQIIGVGWRAMPVIAVTLLVLVIAVFHREPIPGPTEIQSQSTSSERRLPVAFWLYWIVLVLVVAVEMSLAVWGTEFLISAAGLSRTRAALAFGVFPAAMLIGRVTGTRLTRHWSSLTFLFIALILSLAGFFIFWLASSTALIILGLFLSGLGVANQYPLTLSIVVGTAEGRTNEASARASLGVGSALLAAPLLLGQFADRFGIHDAYAMVMFLLVVTIAIIAINHLQLERQALRSL